MQAYGSREQFMVAFNPDVQSMVCRDEDVCFFGGAPTLASINAAYGEQTAAMWLVPQLYNLSEYCGCRDKLQGNPLKECARVIASEFYFLTVTELMLFFHWFKAGRFGRFYGSVDPLVITSSLREFLRTRGYVIERHEQEERRRKDEEERRANPVISYEEYLRLRKARKGVKER